MFLVQRRYKVSTFRNRIPTVGMEPADAMVSELTKPHPEAQFKFAEWFGAGVVWVTWLIPVDGTVELDLG